MINVFVCRECGFQLPGVRVFPVHCACGHIETSVDAMKAIECDRTSIAQNNREIIRSRGLDVSTPDILIHIPTDDDLPQEVLQWLEVREQ